MLTKKDIRRIGINLIWQPLLASLYITLVLCILSQLHTSDLTWALGAGSLSSTAFIVFGSPSRKAARIRNIVGAYLIAGICGYLMQLFMSHVGVNNMHYSSYSIEIVALVCAAIVVGLALLLMSLFQCQHPPAAGLALVVVVDMRDELVLIAVFVCVILIAFFKYILHKYLKDLA